MSVWWVEAEWRVELVEAVGVGEELRWEPKRPRLRSSWTGSWTTSSSGSRREKKGILTGFVVGVLVVEMGLVVVGKSVAAEEL